jgi:hypothetical protein
MKRENNWTEVLINWTDAFNKFGYGDGDDTVYTPEVVSFIESQGYSVEYQEWGCHNTVIIGLARETTPGTFEDIWLEAGDVGYQVGYDDPRPHLPADLVAALDTKFGRGDWWYG